MICPVEEVECIHAERYHPAGASSSRKEMFCAAMGMRLREPITRCPCPKEIKAPKNEVLDKLLEEVKTMDHGTVTHESFMFHLSNLLRDRWPKPKGDVDITYSQLIGDVFGMKADFNMIIFKEALKAGDFI